MSATKSKPKKKNPYQKTLDGRVAVISADKSHSARVRHLSLQARYCRPICGEYSYGWTASKAKEKHKLPICKKCRSILDTLLSALENDPVWAPDHRSPEQVEADLLVAVERNTIDILDLLKVADISLDDG